MSKPKSFDARPGVWSPMFLLVLVSILVWSTLAQASTLAVYFDPNQPNSVRQADPFQEFQYYVAASDCGGDLAAFGFQVEIDPAITVTRRELTAHASGTINMGSNDNWLVGLGERVSATTRVNLVMYSAMLMSQAENLHIELGPPDPAYSVAAPQFVLYPPDGDLNESEVRPFDDVRGALINGETQSWGRLKTNYNDQ